MTRLFRALNGFLIGLLIVMTLALCSKADAGGTDIDQETNVILSGGDNAANNSMGGSRSYGVGLGSIDVDIAQCLGSESTGILVIQWQRLKENPWCMAETLDAKGLHGAAAKVRCSIEYYQRIFDSEDECLSLSLVSEIYDAEPQPAMAPDDDDEDDRIDLLYARLNDLEAQGTQDAEDAKKAARRANAAVQRANQAEIERKEYAQQMIEELAEWK